MDSLRGNGGGVGRIFGERERRGLHELLRGFNGASTGAWSQRLERRWEFLGGLSLLCVWLSGCDYVYFRHKTVSLTNFFSPFCCR